MVAKLGAVEKLFPEIQSLIGVPQDPEWHPEGDVFVHTQLVIDRARELIEELSISAAGDGDAGRART
jgi:tRNA nucleotidyltransferase (CCA-adding enzyme)